MATRQLQAALTGLVLSAAWACSDPTLAPRGPDIDPALSSAQGSVGIAAFSVVDLGTAAGLPNSIAEGINMGGFVAGVSYNVDPRLDGRVTLWTPAGAFAVGVPPGFMAAEGRAINDFGDIVGIAHSAAAGGRRGFFWSPASGFAILNGPPGTTDLQAFDIEGAGLAVVGRMTVAGAAHAFRWQAATGYQDMHPAGFASSQVNSIAPTGAMTGTARTPAGNDHAVMWSPVGAFFDLGTLPGGSSSRGNDINSLGGVVGQSNKLGGNLIAMRRRMPGAMQEAWAINNSSATGISDLGRMVGWAPVGGQRLAATRYTTTGFIYLPMLAATAQSDAREVNLCGHAVGSTTFGNGMVHATSWRNTPCD